MLDWNEVILRLGVATLAGGLIGLNRDLHGKPIGLKTLGLVGLATALVMAMTDQTADTDKFSDAASRITQGVLTGIGLRGNRLWSRTLAHRGDRSIDRLVAAHLRPAHRALAASRARRQGRSRQGFRTESSAAGRPHKSLVVGGRPAPAG